MEPVSKHTFNAAVDEALAECAGISNQRGGEYDDTWALDNQISTFLDATLKACGVGNLTAEQKRLILLAALIDVKDTRMLGPFKPDTLLDGLNYRAAYLSLRRKYEAAREAG